jgi:hypothetical protein
MTAAKQEMVGASKTEVDDKIEELILSHPKDVITNLQLGQILGDQPFAGKLTSYHQNALERAGVRAYGKTIRMDGKVVKVRILRNYHFWKSLESDKIQAELTRETPVASDQSFSKFVAHLDAMGEFEHEDIQVEEGDLEELWP